MGFLQFATHGPRRKRWSHCSFAVPAVRKDEASTLADRLWNELETRLGMQKVRDISAIFVGFKGEQSDALLSQLRELGVGQTASMEGIEGLRDHTHQWSAFDVIIVNHDAFDDALDAVDTLAEFRKKVREKRVILISSFVGGDDFGSERKSICDMTLKAPGTVDRLGMCLHL